MNNINPFIEKGMKNIMKLQEEAITDTAKLLLLADGYEGDEFRSKILEQVMKMKMDAYTLGIQLYDE